MKTSNVDLTKSNKSNFGEYHTGVLEKLKGSRFEDIARLNPYMSYDFKSTPWDDIGDALGFGTEEDEIRREYDKSAREYDSQLLQLLSEDRYNSPAEQSSRLGAAGFNPALSGLSDVENAGEFAQEQTSPSYVRPRSSFQDFGNVMMNALQTTGSILSQYNGFRSSLADLNIKEAQAAGIDLDNDIKISSMSDAFLRQLYGFGAVAPGNVTIDSDGNVSAIFPDEKGNSTFVPYGRLPVPKRYRKDIVDLFNNRKSSLKVLGDVYGEAKGFRENQADLLKYLRDGENMYPTMDGLNDFDSVVRDVYGEFAQGYAKLLKKQMENSYALENAREFQDVPGSQALAESAQNAATAAQGLYNSEYYNSISGTADAELHNSQTSSASHKAGMAEELNMIYYRIIKKLSDRADNGSIAASILLIGLGTMLDTGSVSPSLGNVVSGVTGIKSTFSPVKP